MSAECDPGCRAVTLRQSVALPTAWLPSGATMGRTPHEDFNGTFDVYPVQPPATQSTRRPATQSGSFAAGVSGFEYGFGSATRRFQSEVYPQHLPYGIDNKAVIELGRTPFVPVTNLTDVAPSAMLPEFAASYQAEPGRSFSYGPDRKHPPGPDGQQLEWVQSKDNQPPMENNDPPEPFAMPPPRGTGGIATLHEQPTELLAPAARREALVFDKCQQRARAELRKAANDACRVANIAHSVYPNGILGVEGPLAPQTILYADVRNATLAHQAKREEHAKRRHDNLATKRDTQLPYPLLSHNSRNTTLDRIFTRKKAVDGMSSYTPSTNHFEVRPATTAIMGGFRSNQEKPLKPHNARRAQRLHDINSGGRGYDIISGMSTFIRPSDPSSAPLDAISDRRYHPSNQSMPRRSGTAPTLVGPIPDSHVSSWKPNRSHSPPRSPTKSFLG